MRLISVLFALLLVPGAALAADKAESAARPDPQIRKQLDKLGYNYELDEDGDFKLTFSLDDDRTQLGFVISRTETYGKHRVREIWSPAYRAKDDTLPGKIANRLLEDSQNNKLGAWVKQGNYAVFVVKISADASVKELDDALTYALQVADRMEAELTPGKDEF